MDELTGHLTVFVLACFVGWHVVWRVTAALHTPLMSATNAISGIILVGAMLSVGRNVMFTPAAVAGPAPTLGLILGLVGLLLATINISGGFVVTQRMLTMFRKKVSK